MAHWGSRIAHFCTGRRGGQWVRSLAVGFLRNRFETSLALALGLLTAALFVAASLRVFGNAGGARPTDILHRKIPLVRLNGTGIEDALNQLGDAVGRKM